MELEAKLGQAEGPTGATAKHKDAGQKENKARDQDDHGEDDLVPIKVAKSLSLPIARQPRQGFRQSTTDGSI
jgi:hypothetical protein